jgi:hypothetical protein
MRGYPVQPGTSTHVGAYPELTVFVCYLSICPTIEEIAAATTRSALKKKPVQRMSLPFGPVFVTILAFEAIFAWVHG